MQRAIGPSLLLAFFGLLSERAGAELLGLELLEAPDIFSAFIDVTYDADTDELSVTGFALTLDDDGVGDSVNIVNGTFTITATITETGEQTGGFLVIEGEVQGFGPVLLEADLIAFGFQDDPGGELFEFLFSVTGGDLADPFFGGVGGVAGVILDANGGEFDGVFDESFDNLFFGIPGTGAGVSDSGIPEPTTVTLVLVGLLMCARSRRSAARRTARQN